MIKKFETILIQVLIEKGLVKKQALETILEEIDASGEGLLPVLIKREMVDEEEALSIFAEKIKVPYVNLRRITIEKSAIEKVPVKFAGYYKFIPIKIEGRMLTIACAEPLDVKTQDDIRMSLGYEIEFVLACERNILEALKKYYGLGAETIEKIIAQVPTDQDQAKEPAEEKIEDIEKLAEDASVMRLVNQIILEAYKKRATDIHIEPYRGRVKVRYRIDGVLYNAPVPKQIKQFLFPILSRIKIMANLNIVERRLPQDGRAVVKVQGQTLDLRISFIPTAYGESVVIRVLPMAMLFSLEKLGLNPANLEIFEELIKRPHGINFVTGPTGSGKSTTLYACLSEMNTDERKIVTIEDPVEYEMEGIIQIQVLPAIGLDFARGLRSMLRHDPDIMMVGEVRDLETARIAIRVALTGHLVFSTLHTSDAASGITRLIDIGLEPYLVASSVNAFIGQRLTRVICPKCKEEDKTEAVELKEQIAKDLKLGSKNEVKIYKGKGCEKCNFTGFYGRTAIYEILPISEEIKNLILKKPTSEQIKRVAISRGMCTLRQDGWEKVIAGITTPEEVLKVTQTEKYEAEESPFSLEAPGSLSEGQKGSGPEQSITPGHKERAFLRKNVKIKVHYKLMKSQEGEAAEGGEIDHVSSSKDVSAGGLLFVSSNPFSLGTILELKIDLMNGNKFIQCLARVIRVEEVVMDNNYNIAVCFLDISGFDRNRLKKYIQGRLER